MIGRFLAMHPVCDVARVGPHSKDPMCCSGVTSLRCLVVLDIGSDVLEFFYALRME